MKVSNCCWAEVVGYPDQCSACGKPCEAVEEKTPDMQVLEGIAFLGNYIKGYPPADRLLTDEEMHKVWHQPYMNPKAKLTVDQKISIHNFCYAQDAKSFAAGVESGKQAQKAKNDEMRQEIEEEFRQEIGDLTTVIGYLTDIQLPEARKQGARELAEWVNKTAKLTSLGNVFYISKPEWQSKLKELSEGGNTTAKP